MFVEDLKLGEAPADIEEDASCYDLKRLVATEWANDIPQIFPGSLDVYESMEDWCSSTMMWRLIKGNKRVFFTGTAPAIYFDGAAVQCCSKWPPPQDTDFWKPDLWCLVDSIDPTTIHNFPIHSCSVLLASTVRTDCVGEFLKLVPIPDKLYMPLWTKEEVESVVHLFPDALETWENRFEDLGGVPRLVLQDIQSRSANDINVRMQWLLTR